MEHCMTEAEVKSMEDRQEQAKLQEFKQAQSRQVTKAFLRLKAFAFINQQQAVPCSRASRRKAAREIAKRYLKKVRSGEEIVDAQG